MFARRWLLLAISLVLAIFAVPATAQTITDGRVWTTVSLQGRPAAAAPWRWASDVTLRSRDGLDALDVLVGRLMALYDLTTTASIGAGYVLSNTYPAGLGTTTEHRLFQQFQWQTRGGVATVAFRTRVEERSIEGNNTWALRLRQQVRVTRPLAATRFSLVGWDEIAVHANATTRYARGLDQNRAFAGLGITMPANTRLEAGYLNHFSRSRTGPDRMNHVLALTLSATF
jgi:hypothetical protein